MSLPDAISQSFAVLSAHAVRIPSTVRTKGHVLNCILMSKGGDELARGRIPELGGIVCARRKDSSTIRTKRPLPEPTRIVKGRDELARSRIPELGGFVRACRQDSSSIGTKRRFEDQVLVLKGGDERGQRFFTMND